MKVLVIVSLLLLLLPASAAACGTDTDCLIGDRIYRIQLPAGHTDAKSIGAIVYAHGYRGTAKGTMRNKSLKRLANDLGVALVAAKSLGEDWVIPGAPGKTTTGAAELAYFDALIDDIEARFSIDRERLLATGFSAGGMMVWNLACHRGDSFAGFAPISGTFWEPVPTACHSAPVNLIHIHGSSDKIVPLAGRRIKDTRQGAVDQVLAMYIKHGGYGAAQRLDDGNLSCERRPNTAGQLLEFCVHPGGHSFSVKYIRRAWEDLQARGLL